MSAPKRIQMTRQRPWRADNPDAVIVARPSRWGNPFRVITDPHLNGFTLWDGGALIGPEEGGFFFDKTDAHAEAVREFRLWMGRNLQFPDLTELAGKDLACWCPLGAPCHADVLISLANGDTND